MQDFECPGIAARRRLPQCENRTVASGARIGDGIATALGRAVKVAVRSCRQRSNRACASIGGASGEIVQIGGLRRRVAAESEPEDDQRRNLTKYGVHMTKVREHAAPPRTAAFSTHNSTVTGV